MSVYAVVENNVVTNVVVCDDADHADEQGWVPIDDIDPTPGIGWTYDGTAWTPPDPESTVAPQMPVMVDPGALDDLVQQVNAATTVALMRDALLATLSALGATP